MAIAVKLDEDLSPLVGEPVAAVGHNVATVVGQGWGGLKDPELWERLRGEQRLFITADKGFGDLRAYPPGTHHGILVLRPARESVPQYRALLEVVLSRHSLDEFVGCVTVATPSGVRIRRPPSKNSG